MQNAFCCGQDYVDAFEKLLHLTLKQSQSQREAVHIVFKLCLGERTFNEFYAHLLDKLCAHHRQLQVPYVAFISRGKDKALAAEQVSESVSWV